MPHILETIFFSLDCDSFMVCQEVCRNWKHLFSSHSFQQKAEQKLCEKKKNEEELCKSSWYGDVEGINHLIASGVNPNCERATGSGGSPLHYAVRNKNTIEVIKLLLNAGANPNKVDINGTTPLHRAVQSGQSDMVKMLLEAGADPNIPETTTAGKPSEWDVLEIQIFAPS